MTHEELVKIAEEGGYVRWTKSGVIEHLWIVDKKIWARGLFTRRHFVIAVKEDRVPDHFCERVPANEQITLGEQMEAARKTSHYRGGI